MTCLIPILLTILSTDPCSTWNRVQGDFEEARKRVWWTHQVLDPFYSSGTVTWPNPPIQQLDGWTIQEHPTAFPAPDTGIPLDGLIDIPSRTIQFNAASPLLPLVHELVHFIFYKNPIPYGTLWYYAGHGGLFGVGSLDIMTHALWLQTCDILFKPFCEQQHQYSPIDLLREPIAAVKHLECRVVKGVPPDVHTHDPF